jgi:hypothetical protein
MPRLSDTASPAWVRSDRADWPASVTLYAPAPPAVHQQSGKRGQRDDPHRDAAAEGKVSEPLMTARRRRGDGGCAGEGDVPGGVVVLEAIGEHGVGEPLVLQPGDTDPGHLFLHGRVTARGAEVGVGLTEADETTDRCVRIRGIIATDKSVGALEGDGVDVSVAARTTAVLASVEIPVVAAGGRSVVPGQAGGERGAMVKGDRWRAGWSRAQSSERRCSGRRRQRLAGCAWSQNS